MKVVSISGFVLSVLSFVTALYLQFILVPAAESLEDSLNTGFSDNTTSLLFYAAHESMVTTGMNLVIAGGLAVILCSISLFKTKSKLSLFGGLISLFAFIIGLIHGTHLFS
ncbi:MAG: hypothetical protein IPP64_12325 [Bacteroidetes bacterium]|nr:hypothetical protein [Bacteroidota bacterium]